MLVGRRWLLFVGLVAVAFVLGQVRVGAQTSDQTPRYCPKPITIPADQDSLVNIGVTQGDVASSDITVTFADGIDVKQAFAVPGWTAEVKGTNSVRYTGGEAQPGTCETFPIMVNPHGNGTYAVRAFQVLPSGETVERPEQGSILVNGDGTSTLVDYNAEPNPIYEQVIYVTGGDSDGLLQSPIVVIAVAVVVIAAAAWLIQKWTPKKKAKASRRASTEQ